MAEKKIKTTWVTFDQRVEIGKCYLVDALIVASSVGAATTDLYDGDNTTGRKFFVLSAPASTMSHMDPKEDILLENGLYVDVGSNVIGVLIQTRGEE